MRSCFETSRVSTPVWGVDPFRRRFPVNVQGLSFLDQTVAWRRLCRRSASLLPPTLPDPIPGAIDLLLRVPSLALSLSFCSGCVKQRRGRGGRSIFFPSFRTCSSFLSSLSLCGIHAHFSFHPSFCERRAVREARRGGEASF